MAKKRLFNKQEAEIIRITFASRRAMNLKEIADKTDMSWVTVRKYVNILVKREWLLRDEKLRVMFNYKRLEEN
jgi:DNA-binding IclR family transcriptional regulator